jgi:hypothetical protein
VPLPNGDFKEILLKMRGLKPLARYSNSIPIQVVLSAITLVALTALVTGLLDLFLVGSEQRDPRLPGWLFLAVMTGVPFMLGLIVHRWWTVLITPTASVLSPLVHNLWQCQPQFSCLKDYGDDIGLGMALVIWFIVWISMPTFCGWRGFKLRGDNERQAPG